MTRKLYEIAADIVESQASFMEMSPDSLEQALSTVFVTLQRMKMAEDGGFLLDQSKSSEEPFQEGVPVDPKSSIQEDKVICLECNAEMRQLTARHLGSHGLTIREYKKKWGFAQRQSLSAMSLSKARSKAAKKRGLPEKLSKYQETKRQEKTAGMEAAPIATDSDATATPESRLPAKKRAKSKAPAKKRAKKKAE